MASDPIFGSLGSQQDPNECFGEDDCLEKRLAKMKPRSFKDDKDHVVETKNSINWAEDFLGTKFNVTAYLEGFGEVPPSTYSARLADKIAESYELDDDVQTTAASVMYAEK